MLQRLVPVCYMVQMKFRDRGTIMIIDFHVHCFSENIVDKAMTALTQVCDIKPVLDGRVATAVLAAKNSNIDHIVVLPIATKPSQTYKLNDWASQIASVESSIISFGTIHPKNEDWEYEMERIKVLGLKGIKFHPDYQDFFVDDSYMIPFYRKAAQLGLLIIFHAGRDIGLPPPYHCTPDRMARVLDIVPEATFIASHMGGFDYEDDVDKYLVGKNIYFDVAYSIECLSHERIKNMILAHGVEKVLFATDSPWKDQKSGINHVRALGLTKTQEELILGENAARLLGL